jgi:type II secretory pathway pseudopilin PulG
MHQFHRQHRAFAYGFTLLELLIVIATIMILASILFPIARAASDNANRSACSTNLLQIAQLVEAYRQDYAGYPPPSGMVGLHGIPQESISALALANAGLAGRDFWCPLDPFESRYPRNVVPEPTRDLAGSTYSYGYNYYGLVTTTDGLPFALTSEEAARFFFDSGDPNWSLDLIEARTDPLGTVFYRPKGLFQGLWNIHTPPDTVVSFCLNHPTGKPRVIPAVAASGAAILLRSVLPRDDQGTFLYASGPVKRQQNGTQRVPPIDWRINKAPYTKSNHYDNTLYGDSAGNEAATMMPVVETYYRFINMMEVQAPIAADGAAWYDTGVDCTDGDVIMMRTSAKLDYFVSTSNNINTWIGRDKEYAVLVNENGKVYFNASGNPVEVKHQTFPDNMVYPGRWRSATNVYANDWIQPTSPVYDSNGKPLFYLCVQAGVTGGVEPVWPSNSSSFTDGTVKWQAGVPQAQHCLLVGKVGDAGTIFPIGSCGSYVVKPGETGTLKLAMNDTRGDYSDNNGTCEVWFGFYRTNP